jgi:hypothetical protein
LFAVERSEWRQFAAEAARDAYHFGYPLVMGYRTLFRQAIAGGHGFGRWIHLGTDASPEVRRLLPDRFTPWSCAWLDLRREPWVLSQPATSDSSGPEGSGGTQHLLIASGAWVCDPPPRVEGRIRTEADLIGILARTPSIGGPAHPPHLHSIRRGYLLQPLSTFLGTTPPEPPHPVAWRPWTPGDEERDAFWHHLALLLRFLTPAAIPEGLRRTLRSLGLTAGREWDPRRLEPEVQAGIRDGMAQARADLAHLDGAPDPAGRDGGRDRGPSTRLFYRLPWDLEPSARPPAAGIDPGTRPGR